MSYSAFAVPVILLLLFLYCIIRNIPAYDHFVKGCSNAISLVISIFPFLVAIFLFVELMNVSGISVLLANFCSPALEFFGIPKELSELIILRPFSGNGSLAIVRDIYAKYGVDSYVGHCASVVLGSSDTVFYVVAVYFSTTKIKRLLYTVPICLIASFVGSVVACLLCRIF